MNTLSEHYKLFKESDSAKKAVRQGMFIALYRNMELYVGVGDLKRGTNFYVNWKNGTKTGLIGWKNGTKTGLIGWKNFPIKEVEEELKNFKFV